MFGTQFKGHTLTNETGEPKAGEKKQRIFFMRTFPCEKKRATGVSREPEKAGRGSTQVREWSVCETERTWGCVWGGGRNPFLNLRWRNLDLLFTTCFRGEHPQDEVSAPTSLAV